MKKNSILVSTAAHPFFRLSFTTINFEPDTPVLHIYSIDILFRGQTVFRVSLVTTNLEGYNWPTGWFRSKFFTFPLPLDIPLKSYISLGKNFKKVGLSHFFEDNRT